MTEITKPSNEQENWANGAAYEQYVGRWSRLVAVEFLAWLEVPAGALWLDVGCGTGTLSRQILQTADPAFVTGLDRSPGYVTLARASIQDRRVQFEVADAAELAVESGRYEAVVSGLMLNFLPQPELGAAEMRRATRFDGCVAAYVWDYAGKMEMTRRFWDAAAALDPRALQLDQGVRFPLCKPDRLIQLFQEIGLRDVEARPIDIPTVFRSFDDYWLPFLGGEGSAPGYVKSLSVEQLMTLRERIRAGLPFADDGSIPLAARAWAVRGYK